MLELFSVNQERVLRPQLHSQEYQILKFTQCPIICQATEPKKLQHKQTTRAQDVHVSDRCVPIKKLAPINLC